ncbi:putative lipid II flippase FtsW [soil metagenome]
MSKAATAIRAPHMPHAFARTDRSPLGVWWWTMDRWLLSAVLVLIMIGVGLSFAASPAAVTRFPNLSEPFYFAFRQSIFAVFGVGILLGASMLSPKGVRRTAVIVYIIAIAIMILLPFIGGHHAKGATRWLSLGPFGTLQPSEFMKPALIVLVSWMFAEGQKGQGVPGVTIAFVLYLLALGLLIPEKDFGQSVLITIAFGVTFFMAGVPFVWIMGLGGVAAAGGVAVYFTSDHVASRIHRFFSPDAGDGSHQIKRAAAAIANGGLTGVGPGEGVIKRTLPDMHTDFIYSVGAEELGLVFSLLLIAIFGFIILRGLSRSIKLADPFEQIAVGGLFVLFGQQAFINIAVNLSLIPTKGMTLPFISYGGSSMWAMCLTMGLALALTRRRPGAYEQGPIRGGAFGVGKAA